MSGIPAFRDVSRRRRAAALLLTSALITGTGLAGVSVAKAQTLDWAIRAGGTGLDQGADIAVDRHGNSYLTGSFRGSATFGEGDDAVTLNSGSDPNFSDAFVAKYDRKGALVWAIGVEGSDDDDRGSAIATDRNGNSYVAGSLELDNQIFIAKYSRDGTLRWNARIAGTGRGIDISTDDSGNSCVTGRFEGSATFGEGGNAITLVSAGDAGFPDAFIAKYDSDGAILWAKSAGGPGDSEGSLIGFDQGEGIAVDRHGNCYVRGRFGGTATFGEGEDAVTLISAGDLDAFVAKYDRDGNVRWATSAGGAGQEGGSGIATDHLGDSYVTGSFEGMATFGEGDNAVVLTSTGLFSDVFVAKYNRKGTLIWAISAGGFEPDLGAAIATDRTGISYVTGSFGGTATFGEGNGTSLSSSGGDDVFVAKYRRDGTLGWAVSAGGSAFDFGSGIAADGRGNIFVTGSFNGIATFGGGADALTLTSAGSSDIFVAKYNRNLVAKHHLKRNR